MDQLRYFYSTTGADAQGPVTLEVLGQLFQEGVIGPGSYLCREGGTEWEPLNPANFQALPPVVQKPQPFQPPAYVPSASSIERLKEIPDQWEEEESAAPGILNWLSIATGLIGGFLLVVVMDYCSGTRSSPPYYIGGTIGGFIFFWGIAAVVSLLFQDMTRQVVRFIGVVSLSVLAIVGWMYRPVPTTTEVVATPQAPPENKAIVIQQEMNADARKQIADKGYYAGASDAPNKTQQNVDALKAQATGDTPEARAARDMYKVTDLFIAQVKTSNDIEKNCVFEVVTIDNTEELKRRRDHLAQLKDAQKDVVTFLIDFDKHCQDAMAPDKLPDDMVKGVIAGARTSAHIEQLITLWQSKVKLTEDYIGRLNYLDKSYGSWDVRDGQVVFSDKESFVKYGELVQALQDDVKKIGDNQKAIVE